MAREGVAATIGQNWKEQQQLHQASVLGSYHPSCLEQLGHAPARLAAGHTLVCVAAHVYRVVCEAVEGQWGHRMRVVCVGGVGGRRAVCVRGRPRHCC